MAIPNVFSPFVSEMLKKGVKGLPSDTRPYTISRGTPLSPSSACTRSTISPWNQYKFTSKKPYYKK